MSLLSYVKRYAGGFSDLPATTSAIDAQFLNAVETALLGLLGANPADGQVQIYDDALGRFKTSLIKNAHIDATAAIDKSKLASLGIVNADVAAGAAIDGSKIAGNFPVSNLAGYPGSSSKVLKGDGSWGNLPGYLAGFGLGQAISTSGASFAAGQNLLAANISLTGDGTSRYALAVLGGFWGNSFSGNTTLIAQAVIDGAAGGNFGVSTGVSGNEYPFAGGIDLGVLSAAAHTINVRIYAGTGTTTLSAGSLVLLFKVT